MLVIAVIKLKINMRKYIIALITLGMFAQVKAQTLTEIIPYSNDTRVITTGVPFLLISSDARAAGMGDIGELYPDTEDTYAGADSKVLLRDDRDQGARVLVRARGIVSVSGRPHRRLSRRNRHPA